MSYKCVFRYLFFKTSKWNYGNKPASIKTNMAVWNTYFRIITYSYYYNIAIYGYVKCTYVHRMFVRIEIRKARNTDDSLGKRTKLLLSSLSLGFQHEERETQFFYVDCSSIVSFQLTDSTNTRTHPAVHKHTGLAQVRKINSPCLNPNLNSFLLFKITKNPSPSLPGMMSFTSPVQFPIWGFYCDICDFTHPLHACVDTCTQCVHLTNPCTNPKGSKPN